MSEVKRYGIHFAVAHMMKEDSTGGYVLASDYAALEAELKKVKADRTACWAEFKVMTKSCLDAEKERDAALAECERLRDENAILRAGMKGDYDLDAWLEWVKEKSAMLRQEAALLTDARQQLYQACISREDEQELKAMIDRIDARLAQCRRS